MPKILVKEFAGIAVSSGTRRTARIKKEKQKGPYQPVQDYYKKLREAIIASHKKNLGNQHITDAANSCANPKRKPNYISFAISYIKWVGSQTTPVWFDPPRGKYSNNGVDVIVNPELGLIINGKRLLIKLYFNQVAITQAQANMILFLMETVTSNAFHYGLLDIKKNNLITFSGNRNHFTTECASLTASIAAIWPTL